MVVPCAFYGRSIGLGIVLILCLTLIQPSYSYQYPLSLDFQQQRFADPHDKSPTINISQGWIVGVRDATPFIYTQSIQTSVRSQNVYTTVSKKNSSLVAIDSFRGIPYAQPPIGNLRFRKPVPITHRRNDVLDATKFGPACPQLDVISKALPYKLPFIPDAISFQLPHEQSEDCLTINVQRPVFQDSDNKQVAESNLPVMVWFYGGGFEIGDASLYDGANIVRNSAEFNKPVIFVSFNYRLNAFGFLPGSEALQSGDTNVGLRDQELALKWIQENIHEFGGNPEKVTLIGQSAGAISIALHLQHFYEYQKDGHKLPFSNVILHSGSALPTNPIDSPRAQKIYDQLVESAGCPLDFSLECLRSMPYEELKNAIERLSFGVISYSSLSLQFVPRPDNTWLKQTSEAAFKRGEFAGVPMISGDVDDEGTMFALGTLNITTEKDVEDYFQHVVFPSTTQEERAKILEFYPQNPSKGSPFGTGPIYGVMTPQNKRISAIIGDAAFQAPRRMQLDTNSRSQPTWSYIFKDFKWTSVLGSFHTSDLLYLFPSHATSDTPHATELMERWLTFTYTSNPNIDKKYITWPEYKHCPVTNCQGVILEWSDFVISQVKEDSSRLDEINYMREIVSDLAI